jgi:hypothetical protein
MSGSNIAIRTAEDRAGGLCPAARLERVTAAFISEESQLVTRRPAVARRVREVRAPVMVHCRRALVNGRLYALPGVCRLREEVRGSDCVG